MNTKTVIAAFIDNRRARNLSPVTVNWYSYMLGRFAQGNPTLPKRPEPVEAFLAGLAGSARADYTVRAYFVVIRAFYRFAQDRFNAPNPMVRIHQPKVSRRLRPTLEPLQVGQVLATDASPRDHAMLMLLADSGIRAGELVSLRANGIGTNTIMVVGKTGQREVPISSETRRMLKALARDRGPDDPVFWGRKGPITTSVIYRTVAHYLTLCGITGPKLGPHRLRHAFGKAYLVAGGDLRSLQVIIGHSNIATTEQYLALTKNDIIAKHRRFSLLRSAEAAVRSRVLDPADVLAEAEAIITNKERG